MENEMQNSTETNPVTPPVKHARPPHKILKVVTRISA